MNSNNVVRNVASRVESTQDLRKFIANVMLGVRDGTIPVAEAAVIIKGGEVINDSLYSEIKAMSILTELGKAAPELGDLPLTSKDK